MLSNTQTNISIGPQTLTAQSSNNSQINRDMEKQGNDWTTPLQIIRSTHETV